MINLDKKELQKIATLSALKVNDKELDELLNQITKVLEYTKDLDEIKINAESKNTKNINILRDDIAQSTNSSAILSQAPEEKNYFFVVPKILK